MNEVALTQVTPPELLRLAISSNADLDKLEKLMALQERWEANEARKAYHVAMAAFKASPPKIGKDKAVKFGNTAYSHATLSNVTETIGAALSRHGLTASWATTQDESKITVTCRITHVLGHSESTALSSSPDSSGSKNQIQAIGSAITYLERYTLLALTGLATHEQDDDGVGATEFITAEQAKILTAKIKETGADSTKFLEYMGAETIDTIPAAAYRKAITALAQKVKK